MSLPPVTCNLRPARGFTLVETLVAVGVLMIAIAAPLTLIRQSLTSADASKSNLTAENLARDALEYVKNVRDTNLKNEADPWTFGLDECIDKTCTVDTTRAVSDVTDALVTVTPGASPFLKYESATNRYGYVAGTDTSFRREMTITTIDPDREYRADVTVTWTRRGIPYRYTVGQNMHKLVSVGGCSTPAVNGLHVGIDPSDPNYGYLDCGMLLHYTFDAADVAGTTARDTSGFGNDAIKYGGVITNVADGKRGEAIDLDGVDDKLEGALMDMYGDFTMTAWVRGSLAPHGTKGLAGKPPSYKFKGVDNAVEFQVKAPDGVDHIVPANFDDGQWHLLTLTFDSSGAGPYVFGSFIDGVSMGSETGGENENHPVSSPDHFVIGCWADSTGPCFTGVGAPTLGGHFDGQIDDVRIYGRTLDTWEIQALYDNTW